MPVVYGITVCVINCTLIRKGRFFFFWGTFQSRIKKKRKRTYVLFLFLWLTKKTLWLIYPYVKAQMWYLLTEAEVTLQQDNNPKKHPVEVTHQPNSVNVRQWAGRSPSLEADKRLWKSSSSNITDGPCLQRRRGPNSSVSHFHHWHHCTG